MIQQNKLDEAEKVYYHRAKKFPNKSMVWNELSNLLKQQNKLNEVENLYRKAIQINPREGWAWEGLGNILVELNKTDEAIKAYKQCINLRGKPTDPFSLSRIGYHLVLMNHIGKAIELHQFAMKFNIKEPWMWIFLGDLLYQNNNSREAIEAYRQALKILDSKESLEVLHLGDNLVKAHKLNDAINFYREEAKKLAPMIR